MKLSRRIFQFVVLVSVLGWTFAASPSTCYKCKHGDTCKPPKCVCCGKDMPLEKSKTPQMVFFTFDDAVNTYVASFYRKLFDANRRNPNGCPISMTLFISHANTVYSLVREFYQKGFEIASHSVTHSHPSMDTFKTEAGKQKENLAKKARIPKSEIQGWRSPFLEPMGDAQPNILQELGYEYDATLTISRRKQSEHAPLPFTLDYGWPYDCKINPCPKSAHRGFWEVPVVSVTDYLGEYDCVYVDGCNNPPPDEESAYNFLWENFNSYYKTNRAPFGINMHAAWFYVPERLNAMDRFIQDLLKLDDVYIVSVKQVIAWLKSPTPLEELKDFQPWSCANPRDRDAPKLHAKGYFANDEPKRNMVRAPSVPRPEIAHNVHGAHTHEQIVHSVHTHEQTHRRTNAHSSYQPRDSHPLQRSHNVHHSANRHSNTAQSHQSLGNSYIYQRMLRRKALREKSRTTSTTLPPPPVRQNHADLSLSIPTPPKQLIQQTKPRQHLNASPIYTWQSFLTNVVNNEPMQQKAATKPDQGTPLGLINRSSHSHNSHYQHGPSERHHQTPPKVHVPQLAGSNNQERHQHKSRAYNYVETTTQQHYFSFVQSNSNSIVPKVEKSNPVSPLTTTISPRSRDTTSSLRFEGQLGDENRNENSPFISSVREWIETQKKQANAGSGQRQSNVLFQSAGFRSLNTEQTTQRSNVDQDTTMGPSTTPTSPQTVMESPCKQGVNCKLPECFCKTTKYPTFMNPKDIPQIVYITIDGPINFLTYSKMKTLFKENRQNPNGCRIGATFFANGRGTSYRLANILNNDGIEIGMNGQQTTPYESSEGLQADINQQSDYLRTYAGISEENIQGWRSPQLSEEMNSNINVLRNKTLYDSSLVLKNQTGLNEDKPWPFTLDFLNCERENCSSKTSAGIWEVPIIPMKAQSDESCAYADKCRGPKTTQETVDYLMKNFNSYYERNRAPFGIHISRDWFYWYNNRNFAGLSDFIDKLLQKKDVYIVPVSKLLQWVKNPVSLSSVKSFASWSC